MTVDFLGVSQAEGYHVTHAQLEVGQSLADRCIKYLDGFVLEGRVITAKKRPGDEEAHAHSQKVPWTEDYSRYLGLRTVRGRGRSRSYYPYSGVILPVNHLRETRVGAGRGQSRSYSSYSRSRSPRYSSERDMSRSRQHGKSESDSYYLSD
nr:hypothetical protein [Tanacetum cinerariifolium]